ncbi:hypothetical protein E2C01_076141 [Portunus trituberculatus]|uniref:Uncharacterized protein n=1 Tax=Portunus trituberculatus TaxID=210409 RepID=A0A5B7IAN1_PORTR|nr:hypothetical protein [Portunus trituberculatus]
MNHLKFVKCLGAVQIKGRCTYSSHEVKKEVMNYRHMFPRDLLCLNAPRETILKDLNDAMHLISPSYVPLTYHKRGLRSEGKK